MFLRAQLQEARKMRRDSDFWDIGSIGAPEVDPLIARECAVWDQLQATPSYCERFAAHTNDRPFCQDMACGCHYDGKLVQEHLLQPVADGALTSQEAMRHWRGEQS